MRNRIPVGLTDVFVGMFLCILIGTLGVSTINGAREVANKAKCASNLHQIGLAILLYQNENSQLLPRTVADTTGNPKPTWGTPYETDKKLGPIKDVEPFGGGKAAPAVNDVTSAFFLLIRNEQITPIAFICPSTKLKPWDYAGGANTALEWTNWNGIDGLAKHLSYSYQNPYPSNAAIANGFQLKNPDATFAVAADMNPGGDAVTKVTPQSTLKELQAANSLNHGGEGQNVLYGDGHAEWLNHPFCGTHHDNIYTAFGQELNDPGRTGAVIVSSSFDNTDSILLPTAADIGYTGPPKSKPLNDVDLAKLKNDMRGVYSAPFAIAHRGHPHAQDESMRLTIDEKSIKCEVGPMTILYQYEVTGTEDGAMLVNLTAPKTETTGSITVDGNKLTLDIQGDFPLDFPWEKASAAQH